MSIGIAMTLHVLVLVLLFQINSSKLVSVNLPTPLLMQRISNDQKTPSVERGSILIGEQAKEKRKKEKKEKEVTEKKEKEATEKKEKEATEKKEKEAKEKREEEAKERKGKDASETKAQVNGKSSRQGKKMVAGDSLIGKRAESLIGSTLKLRQPPGKELKEKPSTSSGKTQTSGKTLSKELAHNKFTNSRARLAIF